MHPPDLRNKKHESNRMKNIIHVVGNRPQFIKLAVLHHVIANHTDYRQQIIHTGQHSSTEMSGIFFDQLSIPLPDVQLHVEGTTADVFIGNASLQIQQLLEQQAASNDIVFVYGDTNTTLAAALAARRTNRMLLHFEAGVRTADVSMPEEINRILTDRLSQVHYCCTQQNLNSLQAEGFGTSIPSQLMHTGDLMLDAFLQILPAAERVTYASPYIACTIHRAANITNRENLFQIVSALNEIHQQTEVIVPLHPHTKKRLHEYAVETKFTMIEPLGYGQMKRFILDADVVITDSGGASREAFFAQKKSLIVMQHPFWPEIVEARAALHCSANKDELVAAFHNLHRLQPSFETGIFGNGNAAVNIARHLNSLV